MVLFSKTIEIMKFVSNIQDLKENRNYIIETIKTEEIKEVKEVMSLIVSIVTSSNYELMDLSLDDTIYKAIDTFEATKNDSINIFNSIGNTNNESSKQLMSVR